MFTSIIKIVLTVQALLFLIASHSALMACKIAEKQPHLLYDDLSQIADFMPDQCYEFPEFVFSISDYLVDKNPVAAKALV